MTSRELQIILKELAYLKDMMGVLDGKVSSLDSKVTTLDSRVASLEVKHDELRDLVINLAEDQAATQEMLNMFIVHISRHDEDIKMLKTKVGC